MWVECICVCVQYAAKRLNIFFVVTPEGRFMACRHQTNDTFS